MVDFKRGWSLREDSVQYSVVLAGLIVSSGLDLKAVSLANITQVSASFRITNEQNQLKQYSSSTIAWIPSTQSFMLFFPVCQARSSLLFMMLTLYF